MKISLHWADCKTKTEIYKLSVWTKSKIETNVLLVYEFFSKVIPFSQSKDKNELLHFLWYLISHFERFFLCYYNVDT